MAAKSGVGTFLIKTLIIVVAIGALLTYIDSLVESRLGAIETRIILMRQSVGPIGGRAFWSEVERKLDDLADPTNDLSVEKKQKIIRNIRTLSARWRPFIDAAIVPEPKSGQSGN